MQSKKANIQLDLSEEEFNSIADFCNSRQISLTDIAKFSLLATVKDTDAIAFHEWCKNSKSDLGADYFLFRAISHLERFLQDNYPDPDAHAMAKLRDLHSYLQFEIGWMLNRERRDLKKQFNPN
jgi:hypothetical protein